MTIYLIRHGQKEKHAGDPALTELGHTQAKETGLFLKQFPITKIVSSPYKRTVETAINIAKELNLEHTLHDGLVERMNKTKEAENNNDFFAEWFLSTNNRDYVPKYGDSSRQTGTRIQKVIEEHYQPNSHLVLVTHGGAIVDYLRNIFDEEQLLVLKNNYKDIEGEYYRMLNCSINKIVFKEKPTLELVNYIEHLSEVSE